MRLIDADRFKQQIAAITIADNLPAEKCNAMCRLIDKQPTVGDVDIAPEMAAAAYNMMRKYSGNQVPTCKGCLLRGDICDIFDKCPMDWPDLEVRDEKQD